MIRNQANQVVRVEMIDLAGNPYAGAATVYVTVDNNAQAIGSVGGGAAFLIGHGLYGYLPSAAETNGASCEYTFIGAGAPPASKTYDTLTPAQASALQSATGPGIRYVLAIITRALVGLNVYATNEPIKPADAQICLDWLNLILDDWAAEIQASYAAQFLTFTATGGLQPHTIGPSGTWTVAARPPTIDAITLILGSGLYRNIPVSMDPQWWAHQTSVLTSTIVAAFYSPDEPNGSLYFRGIPSGGESLRLMMRTTIGPVGLTDVIVLPQGYASALTLTLQEAIAEPMHATLSSALIARAGKARARIFGNNLRIRPLSTSGLGLPGTRRGTWWDYRTGLWRS